jgi:Tol biopolymer transport system component
MRRHLYKLTLFFLSACSYGQVNHKFIDYAFERNSNIYYHIYDHDSLFVISNADMPNISPNGLKLAFREYRNNSSTIKVFDITANKITEINTNATYNHSPSWNPNGSCLAFISVTDSNVVINFQDTTGKLNSLIPPNDCITAYWASDNETIILNNLDSLWFIDKSGTINKSYNIKTIIKDKWIVTPSAFGASDNNRYIFFIAFNNESSCRIFPDGPSALYRYDFKLNSIERITDNNLNCRDFSIQGSIIFISATKACSGKQSDIYKYQNNSIKKVLRNGLSITTTKQNSL